MNRRVLTVTALAGLALLLPSSNADIVRESTGQRRTELDRMELTAFPADAWSKLTAWSNGEAQTSGTMNGKPVLIMTFATWQPASLKAAPIAQSMLTKYGSQGLVVIGVHTKQGFDDAAATAKAKGWTFPVANDSSGEFRKAIKSDHDPECYMLDRAGHLRYAAITAASVDEACSELVDETKEAASDIPRIRKDREEKDRAKNRLTTDINTKADLSSLPAVPPGYTPPPASAYKGVDWPRNDEETAKKFGLRDDKGNFKDVKIGFQPQNYYPAKPELQGRAIVIYIWHPDLFDSYSKTMPQMDLLQQSHLRDLAIIGAAVPIKSIDPQRANNQQPGADDETPEKLKRKYLAFVGSRTFKHALAVDGNGSSLASLAIQGGSSGFPIPGAMVISSDGIIRWVGSTNSSDFKYAIDTIVAVDPAVQARKKADREFIEQGK
jgi:hypothetical protein